MSKFFNKCIVIILFVLVNKILCFGQEPLYNNIRIIQGNHIDTINQSYDTIILEKLPFSIRFYSKPYSYKSEDYNYMRITVLDNIKDISFIKVGQNTSNIPFLVSGSTIAIDKIKMYTSMCINNEANHDLFYENKKSKSVSIVSKKKAMLELEWNISSIYYQNKTYKNEDFNLSTIYFIIVRDNNFNNIIDENEVNIVTVIFK